MPYRLDNEWVPRLVVSTWGDSKCGKTDFALSFPEPIFYGNFNLGVAELLTGSGRWRGRDVELEDFVPTVPGDHECEREILDQWHNWYLDVCAKADQHRGTVVIDLASELWRMVQDVKLEEARRTRFGKQSKVDDIEKLKQSRLDYGPVNAYMAGMLKQPLRYHNCNAVFINGCKSKYGANGQELNELAYQGFGALPSITQATLRQYKEGGEFKALVTHCRHDTSQEGMVYMNDYEVIRGAILGE